jgi:hypothetical protein
MHDKTSDIRMAFEVEAEDIDKYHIRLLRRFTYIPMEFALRTFKDFLVCDAPKSTIFVENLVFYYRRASQSIRYHALERTSTFYNDGNDNLIIDVLKSLEPEVPLNDQTE